MNFYGPNVTPFPCERCARCDTEHGIHRALVNAGQTAMFWGGRSAIAQLVIDADRASVGPGMICAPNEAGNLIVYLWLNVASEIAIAEAYWPGCVELGLAEFRRVMT